MNNVVCIINFKILFQLQAKEISKYVIVRIIITNVYLFTSKGKFDD